ncbi:MAG: hypothetical protein IKP48_01090 [Bacteroidaceae bacterium]|nr:hypothetical protein [Bacteroidaceae bacterium]
METKRKLYIAAAVLIVLVVALGLLTACTSESLVAYEAPAVGTAPSSYTLTVHASKGEAVTRALLLNNENTPQESLDAVWMTTETIDVYKGETKVGELTPQEDNVSHTLLKGEVSNVAVNDVLTLKFLSPDYATQDGTLDYIAANCDYATASVTVLSIDGTDVTTTGADFENQQSIVKFTLQDKGNSNAAISATEMYVVADGHTYTVQPTASTNEFFVALPSFSEKAIQVTATNDTDMFNFVRENITIECGKYYTMTMQMDKFANKVVDLSTLNGNYVAMNGAVLTGTIDHTQKIIIAAGASITLHNASINASGVHSSNTDWAGITCLGNATITLVGTNVVNGCEDDYPGIQAGPANTTLTINGTGSLTAKGGDFAAGIGSGYGGICGNISISGGTISSTGGEEAAGIGSGAFGSCGNISISGGTITATGGEDAAGIGSGNHGRCGDITISGTASGSATGGNGSAYDIGPGAGSTCGTVSVQGNTISGTCPVAACTFTLNFYENYNENGGMNQSARYNANASTIKVTIGSEEYTATGTYHHSSNVSISLPVGTGMTLTITAPDTEYWYEGDGHQTGDFSATLTNVTLYKGLTNDLGEVNLVKQ